MSINIPTTDRDDAIQCLKSRSLSYKCALETVAKHGYDSYLVELIIQNYRCSLKMAMNLSEHTRNHEMVIVAIIKKTKICSLRKAFVLAADTGEQTVLYEAIMDREDWKTGPIDECVRLYCKFINKGPDHPLAKQILGRDLSPTKWSSLYSELLVYPRTKL